MTRSDVLVDADWVEAHLGDPGVVIAHGEMMKVFAGLDAPRERERNG